MKRRDFIRNIAASTAGTITIAGTPIRLLAGNTALKLAAATSDNDHVLIFIQLHGGNDALNTLIPVEQYSRYYEIRANIAIPDHGGDGKEFINVDDTIEAAAQVGLHPAMIDFKRLYDQGKAVIVQNVGYPDMNGSHFRGRDLVFMGLDGNDDNSDVHSGWMGRFLDHEYPGYPDEYPTPEMPDPIAIEIGNNMSLAFHRDDGIPIGLNIASPEAFFQLISGVGNYNLTFYRPEGHAGDELEYLWQFQDMSNLYAGRLKDVYDAGTNSSVNYPEEYPHPAPASFIKNPLSGQLRLIARLLSGGIKTRIFVCRIGGFDTHAAQVEPYDATLGAHAALLYHLSSAVKAFQDDLANVSLEDKVLTMTFTEFGRRAESNNSYGTDHGTSTPVFVFGKALAGKIVGTNPDLYNLSGGNLQWDIDYRRIYTSVVQDWFGADPEAMEATGFGEWVDQRIDLFGLTGTEEISRLKEKVKCFPNPAHQNISFQFFLNEPARIQLKVINSGGKAVLMENAGNREYGSHRFNVNISSLTPGNYIFIIEGKTTIGTGQFIKY
jgi:uncharacterized protein (DUF1501 family)